MGTLANSEDPDGMPHNNVAFHLDLHCLLRQNLYQRNTNLFENYNLWFLNIYSGPY